MAFSWSSSSHGWHMRRTGSRAQHRPGVAAIALISVDSAAPLEWETALAWLIKSKSPKAHVALGHCLPISSSPAGWYWIKTSQPNKMGCQDIRVSLKSALWLNPCLPICTIHSQKLKTWQSSLSPQNSWKMSAPSFLRQEVLATQNRQPCYIYTSPYQNF